MELTQVRDFNLVVGKVFAHLANRFPNAADIDASSVGFEVVGGWTTLPTGISKTVDPSAEEIFFGQCVHWLIAEGYVRVAKSWDVSFREAVLTQKALVLTKLEPHVLRPDSY
ncbi:hypothetical protein ACNFBR_22950 [Pseudomonas sp. NY11955]|uniref:hypothetical protein n=1 Tax=Pseudomonas sp. NY11955 TaxID=3400363 RepID=UPI003A87FE41